MLKVGLTGNVASGKSSVVRVWRSLGATVIDADELARRAVLPGTPGLRRIVERWGNELLDPSGMLDRARLRGIVFDDAEERKRLEEIVHPEVQRLREEEFRAALRGGARLVVADIPLLFEVGLEDEFDLVVLVHAPAAVRRERLVRDRGLSLDMADRMIAAQLPSEEKRGLADLVIENAGTLEELKVSAERVWRELERRAEAAP